MALPSWAKETVTRIRPGIKSSRGSDIPDWSKAITAEICGCSVQPAGTMLSQDGRVQGIQDGLTCYLPPEADVKAGDRIMYDGKTYTINGEPQLWKSPTGVVSNMQLTLERWSG